MSKTVLEQLEKKWGEALMVRASIPKANTKVGLSIPVSVNSVHDKMNGTGSALSQLLVSA